MDWVRIILFAAACWKLALAVLFFLQAHYESHGSRHRLKITITVFLAMDVLNFYASLLGLYFIQRVLFSSLSAVTFLPINMEEEEDIKYMENAALGPRMKHLYIVFPILMILFLVPIIVNAFVLVRAWTDTKCVIMSIQSLYTLAGIIHVLIAMTLFCLIWTQDYLMPSDLDYNEARFLKNLLHLK